MSTTLNIGARRGCHAEQFANVADPHDKPFLSNQMSDMHGIKMSGAHHISRSERRIDARLHAREALGNSASKRLVARVFAKYCQVSSRYPARKN